MEKEIYKKVEIEKQEWEFWVWIYELGNYSGDKFASAVWKSKKDAMEYTPPHEKKILVKFKITEDDFKN